MKLHADRAEGFNVIHAYTRTSVSVNGQTYTHSILVPPTGSVLEWPVGSLAELTDTHFLQIAQMQPEVVIFGSGATLRFPPPAVLRPLMAARIGIESMDTAAACRTYNILVAEGRRVMAALLVEP
ncbi:MAG TPA: Mth938-like domain-containing protein [Aquabacterium sp.]|nr:Mth938-like domain-containing protein [Aquabacterium sp.]